jgi:cbb3-type cytochrome oxidase subunit 1
MRGIAFRFFFMGAIYAVLGMALGVYMASTDEHSLAPVHSHVDLIGWVSMGLFGLYYHNVPDAARSRLAQIQFWVSSVGTLLLGPGIWIALKTLVGALAAVSALTVFAGMILFMVIVWRHRGADATAA